MIALVHFHRNYRAGHHYVICVPCLKEWEYQAQSVQHQRAKLAETWIRDRIANKKWIGVHGGRK
jgi:hypothetical protein